MEAKGEEINGVVMLVVRDVVAEVVAEASGINDDDGCRAVTENVEA